MSLVHLPSGIKSRYAKYSKQEQEELFLVDVFLRVLGRSAEELKSLRPFKPDPPDVCVQVNSYSLGIEVSHWIPWNQGTAVRQFQLTEALSKRIRDRSIVPNAKSNLFIDCYPDVASLNEIDSAVDAIEQFFATHDVEREGRGLSVYNGTFRVSFCLQHEVFSKPDITEDNLAISCISGLSIPEKWHNLEKIAKKKESKRNDRTDILLMGCHLLVGGEVQKAQSILEHICRNNGIYLMTVTQNQHDERRANIVKVRSHSFLE